MTRPRRFPPLGAAIQLSVCCPDGHTFHVKLITASTPSCWVRPKALRRGSGRRRQKLVFDSGGRHTELSALGAPEAGSSEPGDGASSSDKAPTRPSEGSPLVSIVLLLRFLCCRFGWGFSSSHTLSPALPENLGRSPSRGAICLLHFPRACSHIIRQRGRCLRCTLVRACRTLTPRGSSVSAGSSRAAFL